MSAAEIKYHQGLVIGVTTFCEVLGVIAFALRLWARRLSKMEFWWDDYLMGVGLVCSNVQKINSAISRALLTRNSSLHPFRASAIMLVCAR